MHWKLSPRILVLCLAVAAVGWFASVHRLDAQSSFFRLSEKDEIDLGRQVAVEIEKEQPILADEQATRYIEQLGQALVANSGRSNITYTFKVVNSADINAFAVPGGFIYVNRGLIEAADNEAELAGVMGHEIGHIVGRHSVDQIRRAQLTGLGLRVLGGLLGDGSAAALGGKAAELVASGAFMKFSRDAERQADRLGAQNLYDAGYDPRGMVTFFEKLAALRESEPNAVEKFFSSHPNPTERSENIADLIAVLPPRDELKQESPDFQAVKSHLKSLPPPPEKPAETADPASTSEVAETADGRPELNTSLSPELAKVVESGTYAGDEYDYRVAKAFAPVFYQALGDSPRFDYITNFDFDGDWRGDNNWRNAANEKFPPLGYVYYAVSETRTHFLVHYAAFHPRDYKGGARQGVALSELIREGVLAGGQYDPTGRASEAILAHENDLEGALVVAKKNGADPNRARVVYVETLAHNKFLKYVPGAAAGGFELVGMEGRGPRLFIEAKGHGIEAFRGDDVQTAGAVNGFLIYRYTGRAEDPDKRAGGQTGYDLIPFYTTFWPRAHGKANETYGESHDYGAIRFQAENAAALVEDREVTLGELGSALNGTVGGRNMARPAWGWFDGSEKDRPLGEWFFSPAETIQRHFNLGDSFPTAYRHQPFLGVFRE